MSLMGFNDFSVVLVGFNGIKWDFIVFHEFSGV